DKFITTDYLQQCLNFTKAAETKNSENAVVIWNMPKLAESFLEHWQDRWNQGRDYRSSY
ncbi:TPA: phospholipase D family protein, partial [Escherichia coli]|nr:phospholipase D family protein [Escherichia coli]